MRRLVGFSAACLGLIALVLLVIWIMGGFENVHLSLAGRIAYGLGVVPASVLGVASMALVFHATLAAGTRPPGSCGASRTGRRSRAELSRVHRRPACRPGRDAGGAGRRGHSACARR